MMKTDFGYAKELPPAIGQFLGRYGNLYRALLVASMMSSQAMSTQPAFAGQAAGLRDVINAATTQIGATQPAIGQALRPARTSAPVAAQTLKK